ncbi:MAG TPA: DUF2971 domain-containing protein [Planctomycetaceae bacterium]|nr:DUF2971 domain-containing protein [Planctomycetaceae bacterium]HQZ63953.1 DUF2971 domain-containing protein [Planctomycetaceae bacterium]
MLCDFLFETACDEDRFVYHYTTADTAFNGILQTHKLRLSPFANVNDPRESKDWQIGMAGGPGGTPSFDVLGTFNAEINNAAKVKCKLLCFATDGAGCRSDKFSTAMFSRGFAHPRMWAQYGQNHKGLCLVFDRIQLGLEIQKQLGKKGPVIEGKVVYTDFDRREASAFQLRYDEIHDQDVVSYSKLHIIAHHDVLFFQKSMDWAAESEYRWVFVDTNDGYVHVDFGQSLVAVVRGADHRNTRETARTLRDLGIRLSQICWTNGVPMAGEYWHKK